MEWVKVEEERARTHPLYGIGGWLLLIVVLFGLNIVSNVISVLVFLFIGAPSPPPGMEMAGPQMGLFDVVLMLVGLAFGTPLGPLWQAGFLLGGVAVLWAAREMWRGTRAILELTREELRERDGAVLARIEEVERVDRSMFAMKPSNGFLLVLNRPRTRAWRPGLWWRLGRRVAVGGVTSGGQTRPMADIIAALRTGQI